VAMKFKDIKGDCMKVYECSKCNSSDVFMKQSGNQTGLYCGDCGKWIKWLDKNEQRLVERQINSNVSNETIHILKRKTWEEFRDSKLLWFINTILHVFGWAIVINTNKDDNSAITDIYPARVKFRGFSEAINKDGYIGLSKYMKENCEELLKEAKE
jgi:hypothetical protein